MKILYHKYFALQITASEVNFFDRYNSKSTLREACRNRHTYPPRFTVAVTPVEGAVCSSKIRLKFVGATNLHTEEVQLNLEQCKLFISVYGENKLHHNTALPRNVYYMQL